MASKFSKCLVIILVGEFVITMVGWWTGYWQELLFFVGPIIVVALAVSMIFSSGGKSRITGSAIVFWVGYFSMLLHVLTYSGPMAVTPEHWQVAVICVLFGYFCSCIVAYPQESRQRPALAVHYDQIPSKL
ncbi:MAG: hypothetical protein V1668_01815 [Patescibacteria group bacterium]